jgi:hypothetical protein
VAELVISNGIGFKRRNPFVVMLLSTITLGVYYLVWWYKINNELNNLGVVNNPTVATLAVIPGFLVVVPIFVTHYATADRIKKAQERTGASEQLVPPLALILAAVAGNFFFIHVLYYQWSLNNVWDAMIEQGAEVQLIRSRPQNVS